MPEDAEVLLLDGAAMRVEVLGGTSWWYVFGAGHCYGRVVGCGSCGVVVVCSSEC